MQAVGSLITRTYVSSLGVLRHLVIPLCVIGLLGALGQYLFPADLYMTMDGRESISPTDMGIIAGMIVYALFLMVYTYYLYFAAYYKLDAKAKKASLFKYIFVNLGIGLITAFATLFIILPGIYVGIKLSLAPYYYLGGGLTFGQALSKSWNATNGHSWQIFGRMVVICVIFMAIYIIASSLITMLTGGYIAPGEQASALQAFGAGLMMIVALKLGIMSFVYFYHIAQELKKA